MFVPDAGSLTARIVENPGRADACRLVYDIAIPVSCVIDLPPELDDASQRRTVVLLDFIRVGLVDWRDLPGRSFEFPINPVEGYVDGSVYFNATHQYADLTHLTFGKLTGTSMQATVRIVFQFYPDTAMPDLPETMTIVWDVDLSVDCNALDQVLVQARAAAGGAQ